MRLKNRHPIAPEELMAYYDGQLDSRRRGTVEEHLKACPQCRSLLESFKSAEAEIFRAEQVEAPEGYFDTFALRVADRIARRPQPAPRPWLLRWGWLPAAATAAFAIVFILSHELYRTPPVYQTIATKRLIPIPIAPEPRSDEYFYQEEFVEIWDRADDTLASQGSAPCSEAGESLSQEIDTERSAAAGPEAKDRQLEAKKTKSLAPETVQPAAPITSPRPWPSTEVDQKPQREAARDASSAIRLGASKEIARKAAARIVVKKISHRRKTLPVKFYRPQDDDICSTTEIAHLEAVIIHLPNGVPVPPPEVQPALIIRLP